MEDKILAKAKYLAMEYVEAKRPPLKLRDRLDLSFSLINRKLTIFHIRTIPILLDAGERQKIQSNVARASYIKSKNVWKIYWMRASGKWEAYDPDNNGPEVEDISAFFEIIDEDKYGCFWG